MIGKDNIESGLHEALQLMRIGDKMRFILPSHLAHGLIGDQTKIPPRASVIYEIELLELR
jgi:FKBP-type peptidyl-prolyl cis-trans isomerase